MSTRWRASAPRALGHRGQAVRSHYASDGRATHAVPRHGEPTSLVIVEVQRAVPDLGAEGTVLFEQIGDGVRVALVEPRGEGEEGKTHGRRVNHGGQHSPERLVF